MKKKSIIFLSLAFMLLMTSFSFAGSEEGEQFDPRGWNFSETVGTVRDFMMEKFDLEQEDFEYGCPIVEKDIEKEDLRDELIEKRLDVVEEKLEKGEITEEEFEFIKQSVEENSFLLNEQGPHRGRGGMNLNMDRNLNRDDESGHRGGGRGSR